MPFESKLKNKPLSGQSREIIHNVLKFFTREKINGGPLIPFERIQERVAAAVGVSLRGVQGIAADGRNIEKGVLSGFSSPTRMRTKPAPKSNLQDYDVRLLRRIVWEMYLKDKKVPVLRSILQKFQAENGYTGQAETLRCALRNVGFEWRKCRTKGMKILLEKQKIQELRLNFLRSLKAFRTENRNIVYLDQTDINASYSYIKKDDVEEVLKRPVAKEPRVIITNAANESGFVANGYAGFYVNCSSELEMTFHNYKQWLETRFLPKLPPHSVLVIGNAPCNKVQSDEPPTARSQKEQMQNWLTQRNIPFSPNVHKSELHRIIKHHNEAYEIDVILRSDGHDVIRLPPHHQDLNPMDLVWGDLKKFVGDRNFECKIDSVKSLCDTFFQTYQVQVWKNNWEFVKKNEVDYMQMEPAMLAVVDKLKEQFGGVEGDDSDRDSDGESDIETR